ncbi:MAG: restriction endonuclease subunit S [Phocaeicola sp.]
MRFLEFSGEWEKVTLKEIADFQKDRISTEFLNKYSYISTENIKQNFGGLQLANSIPENMNVIAYNKNDILLSNIRPYLKKVWLADRDGGCSADVFVLRSKCCEQSFLYNVIASERFIDYVMSGAKGIKMPRGDKKQMENFKFSLPTVTEQRKISALLSLIDERIATQNKVIEDLKLLRDAICDAMFCSPKQSVPRKRIKGFYTDWQKVHLNEICSRVTRKNTNGRCDLVLTIAAQYGLVSQLDFFNKSVASENLEGYYLLQKGDFAYNKSYSSEYTCGAVKRLERYEEGVLSPLYICFRPDPSKVDSDFLTYYFESRKWNREIMDISVEGARNHGLLNISVIDFFNTIHRIPNIEEQRAIAKVVKTIIHKISSEQTILECYVKQRTYLLRQMFI